MLLVRPHLPPPPVLFSLGSIFILWLCVHVFDLWPAAWHCSAWHCACLACLKSASIFIYILCSVLMALQSAVISKFSYRSWSWLLPAVAADAHLLMPTCCCRLMPLWTWMLIACIACVRIYKRRTNIWFFRSQILWTIWDDIFFSPKTFLRVGKHELFRRNI